MLFPLAADIHIMKLLVLEPLEDGHRRLVKLENLYDPVQSRVFEQLQVLIRLSYRQHDELTLVLKHSVRVLYMIMSLY